MMDDQKMEIGACAKCGQSLDAADRYCTQCGARVAGRSGVTGAKVLGMFCLTAVALVMGGVGACWLVLAEQNWTSRQWLWTGLGLLVVAAAWNIGMFRLLRK